MKKQTLLLTFLILIFTGFLFAVEVSGTWYWATDDWNIKYFRYQLDGELEENWTVVDSNVYSVTFNSLDGDVEHTLFVQQSYNGKTWSESALAISEIFESFDNSWDDWTGEEATDSWYSEEPSEFSQDTVSETNVQAPETEVEVNLEEETKAINKVETVKNKTIKPYLNRSEWGVNFGFINSVQVDNVSSLKVFFSFKSISAFNIIKDNIGCGFVLKAGAIGDSFEADSIYFQFSEGPSFTWYSGSDLVFEVNFGFQQTVKLDFSQILLSGTMELGLGVKLNENLLTFVKLNASYTPSENQQVMGITFQFAKSY